MTFKEVHESCKSVDDLMEKLNGRKIVLTEDMEWNLVCDTIHDEWCNGIYEKMQAAGIATILYPNTINETIAVKKGTVGVLEITPCISPNTHKPAAVTHINVNGVVFDTMLEYTPAEFC